MDKINAFTNKIKEIWGKTEPLRTKAREVLGPVAKVCKEIFGWVYKLRCVILSVPVAIGAIQLAAYNQEHLPEIVGLDLQASGEYAILLDRGVAVMAPLAVTAVCILMMFCSRRVVYPWLVSIFTLILPVFILLSNTLLG